MSMDHRHVEVNYLMLKYKCLFAVKGTEDAAVHNKCKNKCAADETLNYFRYQRDMAIHRY